MSTTLDFRHPNDVAAQIMGRDYISFSAISQYQRCPLAFRFKYIDRLPEETISSSLAFGGGVHAAIEFWFHQQMAGEPEPDQDALLSEFWASWKCRQEEAAISLNKSEDVQSIHELADRVLTAFRESELARPAGRVIGIEEQLRGPVVPDVPDLLGRIDLLVETTEALTVIDFKTARSRWSDGQAQDQADQLLLYGELARRYAPDRDLRVEFAVISKTKSPVAERHPVLFNPNQVERTKTVVRHVWEAIESGNYFPTPSPINCPSCPFREPCRHWNG